MMYIFKMKWTLLFINCTIILIVQAGYQPLAIINHTHYGGFARPTKDNIREFLFQGEEKLLCMCPLETTESVNPLKAQYNVDKACEPHCTKEPRPSIKVSNYEKCGADGTIMSIGYYIEVKTDRILGIPWTESAVNEIYFMDVLQFCYNQNTRSVLFVQNTLIAPYHLTTENIDISPHLNRFRDDYYLYDHPEAFYDEENQENSFKEIFHNDYTIYFKSPSVLNAPLRFFVAQQLVESDDLVLDALKKATYYYINTAALWISVKKSSWRKANRYIRNLAKTTETEFLVYTGAFDQLTIEGKQIYLKHFEKEVQIPVPLLFWKLVIHKHCSYGFIVVIYNDIDDPDIDSTFCNIIECPKFGEYELKNMEKPLEGIMHCCEFDEKLLRKLNLYHLHTTKLKTLHEGQIKDGGKELKAICEDKDFNEDRQASVAVIESKEQTGYEFPLALVKDSSGTDLALPDPSKIDKHLFFVGEWKTLLCACPPLESQPDKPLIPVRHERPLRCAPLCRQHLVPKMKATDSMSCGYTRSSRSVGYEVNIQTPSSIWSPFSWISSEPAEFIGIIDFCYNKNNDNFLFAVHKLRASYYLKYISENTSAKEPEYSAEGYPYSNPNAFYKPKNQETALGDSYRNDHYTDSTTYEDQSGQRYFVMQQLVESADMAVYAWKIVTYYYINTIPMWISISRGSWKRANRYIRALSQLLDMQFLIYAGTWGQLEINRKPISLYNDEDRISIPVPAIAWKYIFDESSNRGVVIVIYNDIDNPPTTPTFCTPTTCVKIGHHELENSRDRSKGFVHCCRISHELQQKLNLDHIKLSDVRPLTNDEITEKDRRDLQQYIYDADFMPKHVNGGNQAETSSHSEPHVIPNRSEISSRSDHYVTEDKAKKSLHSQHSGTVNQPESSSLSEHGISNKGNGNYNRKDDQEHRVIANERETSPRSEHRDITSQTETSSNSGYRADNKEGENGSRKNDQEGRVIANERGTSPRSEQHRDIRSQTEKSSHSGNRTDNKEGENGSNRNNGVTQNEGQSQ